ncbi:MAG TPA: ABC transporter ATP-binding protein, partial [Vicinamibacterales bacterium]|nr:ABC transporter ATP-binding protein [Vicinamibacterales bacterium]
MILEFERVSREFTSPDRRQYRVLNEVSLSISDGQFVAIVGPSGCGKSTLLNIAAGLLSPSSGQVRVDGKALLGLNRRATYMFQQDALLPWKNVRENVALGLTFALMPRAEAEARADQWLARVGLSEFKTHYPAQLSGGMRKRVAMAQNWIIDRSVVLMDEPFSALDVHTRQRMEGELLSLWEESPRKTVVFVTHDLEEAIALADEVVVL